MAEELALVAQLGLKNLRDILSAPAEYEDGSLLRAKNAAAQTALNAQLRADENRLQQRQDDGLARVLKLIAEEEARMRGTIIDESPIRRDPSESVKGSANNERPYIGDTSRAFWLGVVYERRHSFQSGLVSNFRRRDIRLTTNVHRIFHPKKKDPAATPLKVKIMASARPSLLRSKRKKIA